MNPDASPSTPHEALYQQDVVRRVLMLREDLIRHDENLKAYDLLECAPYFIADHPAIVQAREDTYLMVRHVLPREQLREEDRDTDPYEAYYASNPHERRFEDQYGIEVSEAHRIPRVQFLLDGLEWQRTGSGGAAVDPRVLDLSANDGWMAARLSLDGYCCDGVDLHPGNIDLARKRRVDYPTMGAFEVADLHSMPLFSGGKEVRQHGPPSGPTPWDAVVCFETLEHVASPRRALEAVRARCKPGGRLYLSTPSGAVEQGATPWPPVVEPKGHVRVFTPKTFRALLEEFGEVEELVLGQDGVLVARVKPQQ